VGAFPRSGEKTCLTPADWRLVHPELHGASGYLRLEMGTQTLDRDGKDARLQVMDQTRSP
jgi:hypothetical protein